MMREKNGNRGHRLGLFALLFMVMCLLGAGVVSASTVEVVVFDENGDFFEDVTVSIYDNDGDLIETMETGSNGTATTTVDNGKYTIEIDVSGYTDISDDIEVTRNVTFKYDMELSTSAAWWDKWVGDIFAVEDPALASTYAIILWVVMISIVGFVLLYLFSLYQKNQK